MVVCRSQRQRIAGGVHAREQGRRQAHVRIEMRTPDVPEAGDDGGARLDVAEPSGSEGHCRDDADPHRAVVDGIRAARTSAPSSTSSSSESRSWGSVPTVSSPFGVRPQAVEIGTGRRELDQVRAGNVIQSAVSPARKSVEPTRNVSGSGSPPCRWRRRQGDAARSPPPRAPRTHEPAGRFESV